ncbi:MAG: UDP-N-acetylmuramoyl-L-alanine--D-glutamate ligase [Bacillota bacterium]
MLEKIAGKRVLVLGLGRSGRAAARLLLRAGVDTLVINDNKRKDLLQEEIGELCAFPNVQVFTGVHRAELLQDISMVIKSPGINPRLSLLKEAGRRGIEIFSEVELAYHFCPVPIAAITGTNGKTTTVALTGEIFRRQFPRVQVAGNIGFPLCEAVMQSDAGDYIVAELSSFQLADVRDFHPRIAAILNISPDHLDYHGSMEDYIGAKRNIFLRQQPGDWSILNWDDSLTRDLAPFVRGNLLPFSRHVQPSPGVFIKEGYILINDGSENIPVCPIAEVRIPGEHNLENALAATAVSWAAGVAVEGIAAGLRIFPGVPHRLEEVGIIRGVKYVNDSKGTNPEATLKAIKALKGPKILIAGGMNKGSSFSPLALSLAKEEVKILLLLGETAPLLEEAARRAGFNAVLAVTDLRDAVRKAFHSAAEGDIVLLSPACASWDMFRDYEERGEIFRREVLALKEGCGHEK